MILVCGVLQRFFFRFITKNELSLSFGKQVRPLPEQIKEIDPEVMERDVSVYMLHTDNTEAMAFDAEEVRSFDGIFGVEASEWETVKDRFAPQDYSSSSNCQF